MMCGFNRSSASGEYTVTKDWWVPGQGTDRQNNHTFGRSVQYYRVLVRSVIRTLHRLLYATL
jgi:hypothetical protein